MSCRPRLRNSSATRRVSARVRAPDAELAIDDRRIDEEKELLAARRAALVDQFERVADEALGQLPRIGDRRRRADERRIRSVVAAHAAQPPDDVRQVAAEDAAIRVQLVDDDEPQILEELRPSRMVRQDARVQHVGIAQHDMRAAANRPPRILRRVAVVGEDADGTRLVGRDPLGIGLGHAEDLHELVQLGELILRERLRRKEIQRARRVIRQDRTQNRRVIAERLARRGRRDDDGVAAGEGVFDRRGLMRVELARCRACEAPRPAADRPPPASRVLRDDRRQPAHRRDVRVVARAHPEGHADVEVRARSSDCRARPGVNPSAATMRDRAAWSDASLSLRARQMGRVGGDDMAKLTDATSRSRGDQGAKAGDGGAFRRCHGGALQGCLTRGAGPMHLRDAPPREAPP